MALKINEIDLLVKYIHQLAAQAKINIISGNFVIAKQLLDEQGTTIKRFLVSCEEATDKEKIIEILIDLVREHSNMIALVCSQKKQIETVSGNIDHLLSYTF